MSQKKVSKRRQCAICNKHLYATAKELKQHATECGWLKVRKSPLIVAPEFKR